MALEESDPRVSARASGDLEGRSPGVDETPPVEHSPEERRRDDLQRRAPADSQDHDGQPRRDEAQGPKRRVSRRTLLIAGLVLVGVVALVGLLYWQYVRHFESTDDAFIDTHLVRVSPQIAGQVLRVYVTDNQLVRAGQPIADLDASQPQAALDQALANETQSQTELAQAQAQLTSAQAAHEQASANAVAANAQAVNARRDYERYTRLKVTNPRAVAQIQLDQSEAANRSTAAQLTAAQQQVRSAGVQIAVAQTQIAGAQAKIKAEEAAAQSARINLAYTHVAAPLDGHVAQLAVAVGNYISPGGQLMAIVPLRVWVTANFKETQLAEMRPGQAARVHVDACEVDLDGRVDSIQRGAGQAFQLLPPQNATGNWVKVVQRVPVKIVLDNYPRDCPIGPGMSVEPRVSVR
jgi:membrane fusion protein, multidrug efflux system